MSDQPKVTEADEAAAREYLSGDYITRALSRILPEAVDALAHLLARHREQTFQETREACARLVETWAQDNECVFPSNTSMVAAIRAMGEGGDTQSEGVSG